MATEYERKRSENIRRNEEMMAGLKVRAKASILSAATKRPRKYDKTNTKPATTPAVIRQSLRTRGLNPDSSGLPYGFSENRKHTDKATPPRKSSAPMPLDAAYEGEDSLTQFVDTLLGIARGINGETGLVKVCKDDSESPMLSTTSSNVAVNREEPDSRRDHVNKIEFDLESLRLEAHNVARLVPGNILVANFLPCENVKMIAAGNKLGNVGFWNLDCENEEDDGVYLFSPHTASVSSLVFQQNSFSRVISSS